MHSYADLNLKTYKAPQINKIAVGYFSATPPIAGWIQAADGVQLNQATDRHWTSDIVVVIAGFEESVEAVVAVQSPTHENRKANGHGDLAG